MTWSPFSALTASLVVALCLPLPLDAQDSPKPLVDEGEKLLRAGRLDEAERRLSEAHESFQSVRALLLLARLEGGRGDLQAAFRHMEKALRLAPNSEEVLSAYARLALAGNASVAAVSATDALVRLYPSVPDYHYLRGVARYKIDAFRWVVESLEESLRLAPERPLPLVALGFVHNRFKRFDEARDALRRSLVLLPDNPDALAALAEAEEGLGNLGEAERLARRALGLADEKKQAAVTANTALGMSLRKQGRLGEARDALLAAVAGQPDSFKSHYQLSLVYARLGERESSRRHREIYQETIRRLTQELSDIRDAAGIVDEETGGM